MSAPQTGCVGISNRLILLSEWNADLPDLNDEQERSAINLVNHFGTGGSVYIYLAHRGRREAEDDASGVRRMGLHGDCLPYLHSLELVVVIGDRRLALSAIEAYPSAEVFYFEEVIEWWETSLLHLTNARVTMR